MAKFLLFPLLYWLVCLLWFLLIQKPLFWLWNRRSTSRKISSADVLRVFRKGAISDCIIASYLTAIPLIATFVGSMTSAVNQATVITVYNVIISLVIGLLVVGDTALYRFWQSKIDSSVFQYMRSLKGATASVSAGYVAGFLLVWLVIAATFFAATEALALGCEGLLRSAEGLRWWGYFVQSLLFIISLATLYLITRGTGIRPYNPSVVYFSPNQFLNHWALNPAFNLIYSLSTSDDFSKMYRYFPEEECREIVDGLFPTGGKPSEKLLTTDRPNVLLVVWESFGADFCDAVGGRKDITPCVSRLADEGVCFTNVSAGSVRTDRGLVCILSGYLAQIKTSLIRYTRKLPNLPALPKVFRSLGYETTAVHGGDLAIMHKQDYYLASGHERIVALSDLPKDQPAGKWGIHDGPVFDWIYDDIMEKTRRGAKWFTTVQTLSSHEPFQVPYNRLTNPVDNSFAYTDASLGRLVDRLRNTPAWDDLLIIIVADHNLNLTMIPEDRSRYIHIPIIMAGGAVRQPRRIDTLMAQTDLAATLLGQLDLPHDRFIYSRDILAPTYRDRFAMHVHYSGFTVVDADGATDFDVIADAPISGDNPDRIHRGKAILQNLADNISKL